MPGLTDAHDHMPHTALVRTERLASPLSLTMTKVAENLRVTPHAGITTVRDAGGFDAGFKYAVELQLMVEAGMTPMQAIVASTRSAAECVGLGTDVGTLEPGKFADLLIVDGNPLEDIAILDDQQQLDMVMKGGRAYVDRLGQLA